MLRSLPPFRADQVGSLLRPQELKEARAKREKGAITAEELKAVEDRCIKDLIAKEEAVGLQGITDGEFRRSFWHLDFLEKLKGVEGYDAEQGITFQEGKTKAKGLRVTGKLDFNGSSRSSNISSFCKPTPPALPKMTIPSPSVLHYRGGRNAVTEQVYPVIDEFYHDLGPSLQESRSGVRAQPGANICSSTKSTLRTCATPTSARCCATAGTIPTSSPTSTPT